MMTTTENWSVCRIVCWALALIGGIAMLIGMSKVAGVFLGLILGIVTVAILGFLFTHLVCTGEPDDAPGMMEMGRTAMEKAKQASGVVKQTDASTVARKTAEAAGMAKEKTAEAAGNAAQTVRETASAAAAGTAEAAKSALDTATDAATATAQKVSEVAGTADPTAGKGAASGDGSGRPAGLPGPRNGQPDDLKQIKGVGPKLEKLLNSMGYYHFDQIAGWSAKEVAWVDENLQGFKGRVSRDNWVDQASTLAGGGETEFSKRVEDGDVY